MIICISPSDQICMMFSDVLAHEYKEIAVPFDHNCFHEMKTDTSLMFIGHGTPLLYGDERMTPEQFVANLISYNLPHRITEIFLVGCGIGEVQDDQSYAKRVARLLYDQGTEYQHIKLYSFSNLVSEEHYSHVLLEYSVFINNITITALTDEAKIEFDRMMAQALSSEKAEKLKQKHSEFLEKKVSLLSEIRELKLHPTSENDKRIDELKKQIPSQTEIDGLLKEHNKIRIDALLKIHDQFKKIIYKGLDIKFALHANKNFEITRSELVESKKIPSERSTAVILMNTKIAELEHHIHNKRAIPLFSFSLSHQQIQKMAYQVDALVKLREVISNQATSLEIISDKLANAHRDLWIISDAANIEFLQKIENTLGIVKNPDDPQFDDGRTFII